MTIENIDKIWEQTMHEIELEVSKANFNAWFKHAHFAKQSDGVIYLGVPNEFIREWLDSKHNKKFLKILRDKSGQHIRAVEFIISKPPRDTEKNKKQPQKPVMASSPHANNELPLHNLYINKKDNLNSRYTFDTFIIGSFNELAYSAAQGILQKPGVYNPLFIYGSTGLGKTHLIQATGNAFKAKFPRAKVYYTSAEKFSNEYVAAVQNNRIGSFKEKYRDYDVFIMDDVQFLSGKEKTQDELFHLFNILYDARKQILFSSDKHPNYIPGLEDRLKSRFSAGMIVDISRPEYESRLAILQTKADEQGFDIPRETIEFITKNVDGNVRELEGILNSLVCQAQLKQRNLSNQEIKNLIKNNIKPKKSVSVEAVVKTIADFYNIKPESIYEKTRRKEIVRSRQITMYILREDFNISFPLIGRKLGGRDHTTVIHSCAKVKDDMEQDPNLAQEVEQLRTMLTM
jgi:chromosomal replication initiator protein